MKSVEEIQAEIELLKYRKTEDKKAKARTKSAKPKEKKKKLSDKYEGLAQARKAEFAKTSGTRILEALEKYSDHLLEKSIVIQVEPFDPRYFYITREYDDLFLWVTIKSQDKKSEKEWYTLANFLKVIGQLANS